MLFAGVFALFFIVCGSQGLVLPAQQPLVPRKYVQPSPKTGDEWSDAYIDKVLANLHTVIAEQGLDPAPLPEEEVSFSDTVLGITWHGSAKVYNGYFKGLSTISRTGATNFNVEGTTVNLAANLGIFDASAHYDARAEFMGIAVHAGVTVDVADIKVMLDTNMDLTPGSHLIIQDFKITDIGHIGVHVDGLGPLDWILDVLVGAVANWIRGFLADVLEGPIRDLIQGILDDLIPDLPGYLYN